MIVQNSARQIATQVASILTPLNHHPLSDEAVALDVVETIARRMKSPEAFQLRVIGIFARTNILLFRTGHLSLETIAQRFASPTLAASLSRGELAETLTVALQA